MSKYRRRGLHELQMSAVPKPLQPVLRAAIDAGAIVTLTARGHFKVRLPNGETFHCSPSKSCAELNARRTSHRLARAGINVGGTS